MAEEVALYLGPQCPPTIWPFCAADGTIRTALALPLRAKRVLRARGLGQAQRRARCAALNAKNDTSRSPLTATDDFLCGPVSVVSVTPVNARHTLMYRARPAHLAVLATPSRPLAPLTALTLCAAKMLRHRDIMCTRGR